MIDDEFLTPDELALEIKAMPQSDRERFLDALRETICLHCGALDPQCQCWNDE